MLRPDLVAASAIFPVPPVTRFAPSPTGHLHLGHLVNAIYTWGVTRALAGRVLLRFEDHDRIRSRPEYETAILEDLDWLGFEPDEGRSPVLRQSDALEAYRDVLSELKRVHHVYACDCSRADIGGERYAVRCHDLLVGRLEQTPAEQCGDLLLRDRDGHWTYQFAVTVDDLRQGVTLVIRGADLLSSTGRQVLLGQLLGRPTPACFLHHPLIVGPHGEKLSKSAGDTGIRELRAQRVAPADIIGRAAAAIGLIDAPRPIPAVDVPSLFL